MQWKATHIHMRVKARFSQNAQNTAWGMNLFSQELKFGCRSSTFSSQLDNHVSLPIDNSTRRHLPALAGICRHSPALAGTRRHSPALAGTLNLTVHNVKDPR